MSDTNSVPQNKPPFKETEHYKRARAELIQKIRESAEYNSIRLEMADEDIMDCVRRFVWDVNVANRPLDNLYYAYMRGEL